MSKYGAALDIGKVFEREQAIKEHLKKLEEEERTAKQEPPPKRKSPVPVIALCLILIFGAWLLFASTSKEQRAYNKATGCAVATLSDAYPNVTIIEWDMRFSEARRKQLAMALLDDNTTTAAFVVRSLSCDALPCKQAVLVVSEDTLSELVPLLANAGKANISLSSAGIVKCDSFEEISMCDNVIVENSSALQNGHPVDAVRGGKLYTAGGNETIVLFEQGDDTASFLIDSRLADSTLIRLFAQDDAPGFKRVYLAESPRVTAWQPLG